ncbi:MAG: pilus assembly protein PilM [bacterium]|nr:pilus assembly protein PilM [bacterium]
MKKQLLRLFPVPQIVHPRACGISIEDDSVVLSQAIVPSNEHDAQRVELAPGIVEHGELKKPDLLHEALVSLRRTSRYAHAVVSLPTDAGFLVRMELDSAVTDIYEGVLLGIEEYVPVNPSELLVAVEHINTTNEGAQRVLVTAYPRALVSAYEEALVRAGFDPVATESSMHALSRALVDQDLRGSTLLVSVGRERAHAIVVVANRPWLVSTIGMGWQRIVDAVARASQTTQSDAKRIVFTHGFSRLANKELFGLMVPAAAALRDEIAKVVRFWDSHQERAWGKAQRIHSVIITGHGAAIPGIERHMEVGLGIRMRVQSPWDVITRDGDAVPFLARNESLGYAAAAGVYIRAHTKQW